MFFYYCPTCGHWQNVSMQEKISTFVDNLAKALGQEPPVRPDGYACPAGHGLMTQITPDDRVSVVKIELAAFPPTGEESE